MKLLVDMNLSPRLVDLLSDAELEAIHWSTIGDPRASDLKIMEWARTEGYVIVTHDLDFGAILAATNAQYPSVLQVRTQNVVPEHIGPILMAALQQYRSQLEAGALVTVDEGNSRGRVLPLRKP